MFFFTDFLKPSTTLTPDYLPYYSVRPRQHIRRYCQPNLFGGFQIHNELKFLRLLYRDVGGFSALQDLIYHRRNTLEGFASVPAVGHQSAVLDIITSTIDSRQSMLGRELDDLLVIVARQ